MQTSILNLSVTNLTNCAVKKSLKIMDQVITFDKSLQQRLQEYLDVLSGYDVLPASAIQKEWGFYLELTLDPNGWQAVWKMQRKTCEYLNIPYPSVVLVFVLSVDLKDLTAIVKVLAVQDDIHIPEKHCVPLIQLWPTKDQDKSIVLDLQSTANSLDMLRFFYLNLIMPWDYEDDDEGIDWKTKHLELRLRLYYDMKNGVLPRATAEHLQSLITEARKLQAQQKALESDLGDSEEVDEENIDNNANFQSLMEVRIRIMEIKGEVDILENPLLRSALIKKHKQMALVYDESKQNVWVIYDEGTAAECVQFMSQVESIFPNETLKFSPHLFSTLECANSNDIFILSESTHVIKATGALENGGVMKGVSSPDRTTITTEVDNVMLDFRGENVVLENLTVQAGSPQCAIIVRRGQVTLRNCKLTGDGKSSTHQGIIVLNGGNLHIVDCAISHFCTAIVGNSGSNVTIENSEIYDCNFGLKIFDNCTVKAAKVTIRNCKDYGISLETENNLPGEHPKIGDFHTLNIIPTLNFEFVSGNNNIRGDAVINQKFALHAVEDLFEPPGSDPTVCIESDEEMEVHHTTVVETACNGRTSPATV